ncbi:MAG: hypothetical protein HAW60_04735 [Bdellovibrionales bacterium]|nr:hypothetical protein [Bdellovibrionales bacterium]
MLKKQIKKRLKLFLYSSILFQLLFINLSYANKATSHQESLDNNFLNQEAFIYSGEMPHGKLKKQKKIISWPMLDTDKIKKNLLKEQNKEQLKN